MRAIPALVDALPQRRGHRAGPVADSQLAVYRPQVALDGLVADNQLVGDAAVRKARHDVGQDLAFTLRQALARSGPELVALQARGGVHRAGRQPRIDRGCAAADEFQLAHQLVAADALQQITGRAGAQRLMEVLLVVVDRQHDHLAVRITFTQRQAQVKPAGALHPDVAEHDVGFEIVDDADCPLGADHLPDHAHPVLETGEHRFEALDDHLMVVDQHESYRFGTDSRVAGLSLVSGRYPQPSRGSGDHGNTLEPGPGVLEGRTNGLRYPPSGGCRGEPAPTR